MSVPAGAPLKVAVMVWAAVLVMKSVELVPVSAENARALNVMVGAVVSTSTLAVDPTLLSVRVASTPLALRIVPPLRVRAPTVIPLVSFCPSRTV